MTVIRAFLALAAAAAFAACGASAGGQPSSCTGAQLAGAFRVVPGSAGAGNIVYALTLKNISSKTCTVTGLPQGRLLGLHGGKLPTHIRASFRPGLTAVLVRLAPGKSARATARFSPDVPGVGDHTPGACQPRAYTFRVSLAGGGTTNAKLGPATPVCERGQLQFSAYGPR
jgi:uncharacterized protein DUF4232